MSYNTGKYLITFYCDKLFFILKAIELPGIKIIRYEDSLSSSNADNFSYQIKKLSTVNPTFIYGEVRNIYKEEFKKLMRFYTKQVI